MYAEQHGQAKQDGGLPHVFHQCIERDIAIDAQVLTVQNQSQGEQGDACRSLARYGPNRFAEAKQVVEQAIALNLNPARQLLYGLAFISGDAAAMQQRIAVTLALDA